MIDDRCEIVLGEIRSSINSISELDEMKADNANDLFNTYQSKIVHLLRMMFVGHGITLPSTNAEMLAFIQAAIKEHEGSLEESDVLGFWRSFTNPAAFQPFIINNDGKDVSNGIHQDLKQLLTITHLV